MYDFVPDALQDLCAKVRLVARHEIRPNPVHDALCVVDHEHAAVVVVALLLARLTLNEIPTDPELVEALSTALSAFARVPIGFVVRVPACMVA